MAHVADAHAVEHAGHPTSLDISKFGMWLFLASEIMFFAGFIGAYIVLRTSDTTGMFLEGQHHLNKMLAAVNTAVLIFSSYTMAMAVFHSKRGETGKIRMYLGLTLLCGLGFMVIKAIEYNAKFRPPTDWVVDYDPAHVWNGTDQFGASLQSMAALGERKGYRLVGCNITGVNAFFVKDALAQGRFAAPDTAALYQPARYFLTSAFVSGHPAGHSRARAR